MTEKIIQLFNKLKSTHSDMVKYSELVMDHSILEGKLKDITFDFEEPTFFINVFLNTDIKKEDCPYNGCYEMISDYLGMDTGMYINNFILPYVENFYLKIVTEDLFDFTRIEVTIYNSEGEELKTY